MNEINLSELKKKIVVVIVTYGNRFHLLKEVIESVIKEGIENIFVINNNSNEKIKYQLLECEKELRGKLKVINLKYNSGSATGYRIGLTKAYYDTNCEFIWLLDDDNKPETDSLNFLLKFFINNYGSTFSKNPWAIVSYRYKKEFNQVISVMKNNPYYVLGTKNSFFGFHVFHIIFKIYRYFKRLYYEKHGFIMSEVYDEIIKKKQIKSGKIAAAPYGGLFFHKSLIEKIGYPNDDFFVYADDFEWTYRIIKSGGEILVCFNSRVEDIESSWYVKDHASVFGILLENGNDILLYYNIRNRIFFEIKYLVDNKLLYYINEKVFLLLLNVFNIFKKNKLRIKLIKLAINDAKLGKLGMVESLKF